MKIERFECFELYGYLDLDFNFNDEITFLTGMNGSGKTSVIRAISALLTPSFQMLARWNYSRFLIRVRDKKDQHTIQADRSPESFTISVSSIPEPLVISILPEERFDYGHNEPTPEDYYDEQLSKHADHPVIELINSLPTPMVLGIDRRSQEVLEPRTARRMAMARRQRSLDIFRGSMGTSLREAAVLAESRYSELETVRTRRADKLREQLILSALDYQYSPGLGKLEVPSIRDSYRLRTSLDEAVSTLTGLGMPEEAARSQLTHFFEKLAEVMKKVPEDFSFEGKQDNEVMETVIQWLINKPQFDRVEKLLRLVDDHVKQVTGLRKPINNYLTALNSFLNDSGKELLFNSRGRLSVQIGQKSAQPLSALSSGESQLVVILTHLSFSPAARKANIFIVDEPELSLHLKWQESFVSAVQTANPKLQIILATHSPAIILDRVDDCVDLTEEAKKC